MDLKNIKVNDIVKVEGTVVYGNGKYEVDCLGVVSCINQGNMLINLDEVDGDKKVGCIVKNSYIKPLSTLEALKYITSKDFDTIEEYLEFLSDEFANELKYSEDAQDAYNNLDSKYSYYLGVLGCVYSLFDGESWSIEKNENYTDKDVLKYLKDFQNEYNDNSLTTIEDIVSTLDNHVRKTMCNVGCDVYTALNLELSEINENISDMFIVDSAGEEIPKIELM